MSDRKWVQATVTYSGGCSYTGKGYKFLFNHPTAVRSKRIAESFEGMKDFNVVHSYAPEPVKAEPPKAEPKKEEPKKVEEKKDEKKGKKDQPKNGGLQKKKLK